MRHGPVSLVESRHRISIQAMQHRHLPRVLDIERQSFTAPWPATSFLDEMERNAFARLYVALPSGDDEVAGYACTWLIYEDLRINNLAVVPGWQRRGVGRRLVETALEEGVSAGCEAALLEVRASNAAALALYESLGFREERRRPGYYTDPGETAVVMSRALEGRRRAS